MARIIPQAGSVFAPRIAAPQVFRPGRAPAKKSKAEEAAEILGLINASIATGQAVYGLGSTIAKDFAPTEAEKLAERQEAMIDAGTRSAVAARKTMDQPKVDAALQAREQAMARMQDARAMRDRQEGLRDVPPAPTPEEERRGELALNYRDTLDEGYTADALRESIAEGEMFLAHPRIDSHPHRAQAVKSLAQFKAALADIERRGEGAAPRSLAQQPAPTDEPVHISPFTAPAPAAGSTFTFTPRAGGGAWSKQIMEQAAGQGVTVPPGEAMKMQLGTSTMFPGARMTKDSVGQTLTYTVPGAAPTPVPSPAAAPTPAAPSPLGQPIDRPLPDKRLVVKFMAAIDSLPANVASIEEKVALKERIKDKFLGTYKASGGKREDLTPRQIHLLDIISGGRARSILEAQRGVGTPVTRAEFLRAGAPSFDVSDLTSSYGALMSQGREAEARELLTLANMAADAAGFIEQSYDVPRLVEAKIRRAIKSGFKGAKAVPSEELSLTEATKVLPPPPRARRRRSKTPPGGKRKPPVAGGTVTVGGVEGFTDDESNDPAFVTVALARGIDTARGFKGKEKDGIPKLSTEADKIRAAGDANGAKAVDRLNAWNPNWKNKAAVAAATRVAQERKAAAKVAQEEKARIAAAETAKTRSAVFAKVGVGWAAAQAAPESQRDALRAQVAKIPAELEKAERAAATGDVDAVRREKALRDRRANLLTAINTLDRMIAEKK